LLTSAGAIADAFRYDPAGELVASYVAGNPSPWRYQGALDLDDGATPLYAIGARAYAPSIAAWTSEDTYAGAALEPASLNRFVYAEADPVSLTDPSGHYAVNGEGDVCPSCLPSTKPTSSTKSGGSTLTYKPNAGLTVRRTNAHIGGAEFISVATADPYGVWKTLSSWFNPKRALLYGAADAGSRVGDASLCVGCYAGDFGSGWGQAPRASDIIRVAADAVFFGAAILAPEATALSYGAEYITGDPRIGLAAGFISPSGLARRVLVEAEQGFIATSARLATGTGSMSGSILAHAGQTAEESVATLIGVPRNVGPLRRTIAGSGPGGYRVPDFDPALTVAARGSIVEVKNIRRLSATPQLRDLVAYAQSQGVPLELFTDAALPGSGQLDRWIRSGVVIIRSL